MAVEQEVQPIEPNNGPGPVPWDRNVELEAEVGTGYFLDSAKAKSSAASHSSVVNDHGDARQLSENRRASTVGPSGGYELSTADWVAYSGARFTHADNIPELKESDITAQDETSPPGEVSRHNLPAKSAEKEHLGDSIRNAFQKSAVREGTNFLPIDALERIVTKDSVREELANVTPVIPPEQLDKLTDQIWEVTQVRSPLPSKTSSKKTTRRKIFAILALMKKVSQIVEFVKEDLYDSDLPFKIPENPHKGLRQLERKGEDGNLYSIQLSAKWEIHELEYFDNFQWQFLAPYFQLSTEKVPKILHYNLENRTIMPFIEDHEVKHTGGYGDVWKVKIHPAHHNHCEDSASQTENPSYAVKRLRHNNEDAFNLEVANLKRFSAKDHLHLIKLLVTFKWREQYYLLFPWADGNLKDFWEKYPTTSDLQRDHQLTLWFIRQCLGIAEGLKMIHTLDKPDTEIVNSGTVHQNHGRHGDLKPENILWFKEYQDKDPNCHGVLKISDFGLTRFHGTISKSQINAEGVAVTGTYRAPEYDVNKVVSQSYDVWTLGCVFLEFVTWYLLGWEEVDKFSKNRATEHVSELKEDVFYNFVTMRDDYGRTQTGARAKHSVANEFQNLYQHKNCSDFMLDFLEFIEKRLLRMGPTNRAECNEIVEKLAAFEKDCSGDRQYCTRRKKKPPARSSTELSLLRPAPLDFTPETDKRIQRNAPPLYTGPVETDTEPYNSQDSIASTSKRSSRDFVLSERIHYEPEAMAESRTVVAAAPMAAFQRTENEVTTSSASHIDPTIPRPQSPFRKVHFPPGRPKERTASMRDLHDIPAEDEPPAEMAPSIPSPPSPGLPPTTKPSIAPEARFGQESPRLSNSLTESTESRLGPTQTDPTINEHKPAVEENPGVQVSLGNSSAQNQSVANAPSSESQTLDSTEVSHGKEESDRTDDQRDPSSVIPPQAPNGHTMVAKETEILLSEHAKPEGASAKLKSFFRQLWCFNTN